MSWLIKVIGVFSLVIPSLEAFAHGGFPTILGIAESETLILRSNFGVWLPKDNGEFQLICEEMYAGALAPPVVKTPKGTLLVGQFKGVFRLSEDTCEMESLLVGGDTLFVRAFSIANDGSILAATSSGGKTNGVFRSTDEGLTWTLDGPSDTSLYYTSLHTTETGETYTIGFSINPDTDERLAVICERSTSGQWDCTPLNPHGSDLREQPILSDCHPDKGCLFHWEGDAQNTTYWWTADGGEVVALRDNGPAREDGLPLISGAVFIPDSDWVMVATRDGLFRGNLYEGEWSTVTSPVLECLVRKEEVIYGCSNPYLPNSFAFGVFNLQSESWDKTIESFQALTSLTECDSQGPASIAILCAEAWAFLVENLELNPSSTQTTSTPSPPEEPSMIQETEESTPQLQEEGCGQSGFGTTWMFPMLGLLLLARRRGIQFLSITLLSCSLIHCGGGDEAEPAEVISSGEPTQSEDGVTSEETETSDASDSDVATARPPMLGLVLLGEFQQEGNFIDENSAKGVIANTVFADPEEMTPDFDSTTGNCSFRTVPADVEIKEPLGLDGGPVSLSGPGLLTPIQFIPFDFGEAEGGVAYDHDLEDGTQTIFQPGESVQVSVAGNDEAPAYSGETAVPGEAPILTPPAGTLTPEEDGSITYTWEPQNSDEVLFEWDAFMSDGSAVQLRCSFPDAEGSGLVPADYVTPFLGQIFTMSVSRVNRSSWTEGLDSLEVVFSRRKVTFVYP